MSGRVFISYSRRDQAAVSGVAAALDELGQEVWLDQELSGGQKWWDAILERIRSCDCFIFALSEASVTSKACRAELDYAAKLGRWILPVSVGPAVPDPLLPPVLAETQRIPSDAPVALARALLTLPPTPPLPDPLPDPPHVPVSYLDQLSDAVTRDHLTVSEQRDLLGSIKQRLRDPEERLAGVSLLHRLRAHPDINAWVAEDIDAELAKVEESTLDAASATSTATAKSPASPTSPAGSTATPPAPAQPAGANSGVAPPPSGAPPIQPLTQRPGYPPAGPAPGGPYYPPPQPRPQPPPPVQPWGAVARPGAPLVPKRKSHAGWWIAAIVGVVLLFVGGCATLAIIGSAAEDDFTELHDSCAAGDMAACDDLFQETPGGSSEEDFGSTCGNRTTDRLRGACEQTFGSFVD
jgi:hypothetical protein